MNDYDAKYEAKTSSLLALLGTKTGNGVTACFAVSKHKKCAPEKYAKMF